MVIEVIASAALGGLAVFFLQLFINSRAARKRTRSNQDALRAEIIVCGDFAHEFLTAKVIAPLYRLPTSCFQTSLRELLRSGDLTEKTASDLIRFYMEVETLNRGLDDMAELMKPPVTVGQDTRNDLHKRNLAKAEPIRKASGHLYERALEAVK
jgi:hypothetical protein